MARFKKKINWKGIVAAVLTVAIILGVAAGITALVKNDTKTISSLSFSKGDLDESGKYVASETALYTKDAFECIGLRVQPDFEYNGTYDVYYYDDDGILVEAKTDLDGIYDEDPYFAQFARIVIHPDAPQDVDEDDFKINFFDVQKYASQIKITVDKDQKYSYENCVNLFDKSKVVTGSFYSQDYESINTLVVDETYAQLVTSEVIKISPDMNKVDVFVRANSDTTLYFHACFADEEGNVIKPRYYQSLKDSTNKWLKVELVVPTDETLDHLRVSLPKDADCYIFNYSD